jgi:hypothetical protein
MNTPIHCGVLIAVLLICSPAGLANDLNNAKPPATQDRELIINHPDPNDYIKTETIYPNGNKRIDRRDGIPVMEHATASDMAKLRAAAAVRAAKQGVNKPAPLNADAPWMKGNTPEDLNRRPAAVVKNFSGHWKVKDGVSTFYISTNGRTMNCILTGLPDETREMFGPKGMYPGCTWFTNAQQSGANPLRFVSSQGVNYPDKDADITAEPCKVEVELQLAPGKSMTITRHLRQYSKSAWADKITDDVTTLVPCSSSEAAKLGEEISERARLDRVMREESEKNELGEPGKESEMTTRVRLESERIRRENSERMSPEREKLQRDREQFDRDVKETMEKEQPGESP